jgi:hypothetical protein
MYVIQNTYKPDTCGSECLPVSKKDLNMIRIFERGILRKIYDPINDTSKWRTRYSNEFYTLYDELDIAKVIKTGRLRWLGHVFRMQEVGPCRKLTVLKPEGTRRVCRKT